MKFTCSIIVLLSFFAASAVAIEPGFYIGAKSGQVEPDFDSDFDLDADEDNPVALQLGYDFGGFAIQGEAYSTENEVEVLEEDAEIDVYSLFGVYRTSGFIYLMGKAGYSRAEVDFFGLDADDTALSFGGGAGLNFADFIFAEAEYLVYEVDDYDLDFFAISANIKF